MDRNLMDYLPPVLREVLEFQTINRANSPEIAAGWEALDRVLANQFLETADALGVAMWEKELHLLPKDTDSLETRKIRIRSRWNMELPYSLPWLQRWLTGLFGSDGHKELLEYYTLHVLLHYDLLTKADGRTAEVIETLCTVIPSNLLLRVSNVYQPVPFVNTSGKLQFRSLQIPLRIPNTDRKIIRLDGQKQLDESWYLDQAVQGVAFVEARIALCISEQERVSNEVRLIYPPVQTRTDTKLVQASVRLAASNPARVSMRSVSAGTHCRQSYGLSGTLTRDCMWRLNGQQMLDGSRKLNASIVKEEI